MTEQPSKKELIEIKARYAAALLNVQSGNTIMNELREWGESFDCGACGKLKAYSEKYGGTTCKPCHSKETGNYALIGAEVLWADIDGNEIGQIWFKKGDEYFHVEHDQGDWDYPPRYHLHGPYKKNEGFIKSDMRLHGWVEEE